MTDNPTPLITITGNKVALGPIHRGLIEINQRWINHLQTSRFVRMGITSMDAEEHWYDHVSKDDDIAYFAVYDKDTLQPIGGVDLHKINLAHRHAELGIMIGEESHRGRGYGTEAVALMCDYGFNALGLNSIMLLVIDGNIGGQKAYERVGFKQIGRRREGAFFAGEYRDMLYYDLLASEFESPVVRGIIMDGIDPE